MGQKHNEMYNLCKTHMHSYVLVELTDGIKFDGIITGLDDNNVILAVPNDTPQGGQMHHQVPAHQGWPTQYFSHNQGGYMQMPEMNYQGAPFRGDEQDERVFGGGFLGYGYPGYGYGYPGFGFGYPVYRPGRFRRLVLPLAALTAISLLPWY